MSTQIICDWCKKVKKQVKELELKFDYRTVSNSQKHICLDCLKEKGWPEDRFEIKDKAQEIIDAMIGLIVEEVEENMS